MQQTLFSLCAVAVFAIYALNSTRDDTAAQLRSASSDTERAATAVARAQIAFAERLAFDEQDVGRDGGLRVTPATSALGTDDDETEIADFDDLDDLDGLLETRSSNGPLRQPDGSYAPVTLDVLYSVRYVSPATLGESTVPTLAKELVVVVSEAPGSSTPGRMPVRVTLRKVFTPGGMGPLR